MLKFFAKYQKIILVVGGSLLMVVFLLPAGGQFLAPDPASQPVGYIDGEEITQRDIRAASSEVELITRLNPQLEGIFSFLEMDGLGWILMQKDAANNGIYMPFGQVKFSILDQIKSEPQLAQALNAMGVTVDQYARAQQHMAMFTQLNSMAIETRRPSEQRLAHFAKDVSSRATVRIVPLKAADRIDAAPDPTEAEIKAHFDKYKDKNPGEGEPYGFGYRLPDRFKVEYITVPIKRVAATITVDDLAGQKYYLENPTEFLPGAADAEEPATPEGPASPKPDNKVGPDTIVVPEGEIEQPDGETEKPDAEKPAPDATDDKEECQDEPPAVDPVPPVTPVTPGIPGLPGDPFPPTDPLEPNLEPLPYKEVRDRVFAKLREKRAAEKRDVIAQAIVGNLTTALRQSEKASTQTSGYYKLDEGYEPLGLDKVQETVQKSHGVLVDLERIDDRWLTAEDVNDMPGLGKATVDFRDFPAPISFYLRSARKLDPEGQSPLATLRLQENVHSRIVYDAAGNAYVFRLTAVEPAHEPESVDEPGVRDVVVKDLKTLEVYETMLKEKQQFLDTARNEGLTKLAEAEDVEIATLENFAGRSGQRTWTGGVTFSVPDLDVVGQSEPFLEGVFNIARKVEAAGGLGAGKAPPALAVDALPVDAKMILAITQLTEYEPVDSATYALVKPSLSINLVGLDRQELGRSGVNPMTRDAIAKRVGFERPEGWDTDEDEETEADATDETAAAEESAK